MFSGIQRRLPDTYKYGERKGIQSAGEVGNGGGCNRLGEFHDIDTFRRYRSAGRIWNASMKKFGHARHGLKL